MQKIELGDTGLRVPRIGFGCSAVMGRTGKTDSLRALAAAWEEGIRFFDTARSYGYGESEALLGEFLASRRSAAVIATKFGILPARQSGWKSAAKFVARKVLAVAPSARSLLQRGAASQFSSNQFTLPVLQQSLEESLRKLQTDCVDLLFLHAAPASVLEQDDLLEAMGRLVEAGKVRFNGLSADPEVVKLALERKTVPLRAMQFPCNVFNLPAIAHLRDQASGQPAFISNHPFGGVARAAKCRAILMNLSKNGSLDAGLAEKMGGLEDAVLADIVLNLILHDTGIHVVVPAMMRVEHIRANVQAVENSRFTATEMTSIRTALIAASDHLEGKMLD